MSPPDATAHEHTPAAPATSAPPPGRDGARVLVYSQRRSNHLAWQTTTYEFEDMVAAVDRARLLSPARLGARGRRERLAGWVQGRRTGRPWHHLVPHVQPAVVEEDHDLFFAAFQFAYQLPLLDRLRDWRRRSRRAVCLLVELWRPTIEEHAAYLPLLNEFDHVFLVNRSSVEPLARRISAPVSYLPFGVDAERLSPYPDPPARVVDCYSMGRRSPAVHAALLERAERERLTYLYDTAPVSRVLDHREHRQLVANLIKRSRYFFTFRINDNAERLKKTGGEEGLALRYFEGAAGGAVLLGSRPQCAEHDECFDWPDSTVEVAFDGSDLRAVMDGLDADPARVARIRRDNVVNSLRRHDWLYRWQRVLDAAGLPHTPAMVERGARLERLARLALADGGAAEHAAGARVTTTAW